jgi:hypothetical protein
MAASNAPQPEHPLVAHLDPAFRNAPALAGWLEYLAHPDQNAGPRVLEFADGSAIESSGKPDPDTSGHVGERSVLRDLTLDRFFAHADVLSGQQVGSPNEHGEISNAQALGTTFDLIEEVRLRRGPNSARSHNSDDVWTELTVNVGAVISQENWNGGARNNARDRYVQLVQWYENHRNPALAEMNQLLVRFAAILVKARADINDLMGKLVETLNRVASTHTQLDGLQFFLSAFETVLDAVVNLPKTTAETLLKVTSAVNKVAGEIGKKEDATDFGIDTSDVHLGYYRLFDSFIEAGDAVCRDAARAVSLLITDDEHGVSHVRDRWVPAPVWPG